jgi:hypothetical protein
VRSIIDPPFKEALYGKPGCFLLILQDIVEYWNILGYDESKNGGGCQE